MRALATSDRARVLAEAIGTGEVLFVGSGSSFCTAQLATLAWRRRGRRALALAASEVPLQAQPYRGGCVVALSQSGATGDVLDALDALAPSRTIAVTNTPNSPLAARADLTVDLLAGPELAVPASKTVLAMSALVLWAARPAAADGPAAAELTAAADVIDRWLAHAAAPVAALAATLAGAQSIVIAGAGYGAPVAAEIALKLKEAAYRHAEGCPAGEFRHGSTAMLDRTRAFVGIVEPGSRALIASLCALAREAGSTVATLGAALPELPAFGPQLDGDFAPLAWLMAGQLLAFALGRHAGIDSDAPRGLRKYLH